jgi:hypothetical protein
VCPRYSAISVVICASGLRCGRFGFGRARAAEEQTLVVEGAVGATWADCGGMGGVRYCEPGPAAWPGALIRRFGRRCPDCGPTLLGGFADSLPASGAHFAFRFLGLGLGRFGRRDGLLPGRPPFWQLPHSGPGALPLGRVTPKPLNWSPKERVVGSAEPVDASGIVISSNAVWGAFAERAVPWVDNMVSLLPSRHGISCTSCRYHRDMTYCVGWAQG